VPEIAGLGVASFVLVAFSSNPYNGERHERRRPRRPDREGPDRDPRRDSRDEHADRSNQSRLDQTNVNLDRHTNRLDKRIDDTRADLSRRLAEVEIRTVTALNDVHGTLREVRDLLRDRLDLRDRVERVERDVAELKRDRKG
jgi:hypothetical protein